MKYSLKKQHIKINLMNCNYYFPVDHSLATVSCFLKNKRVSVVEASIALGVNTLQNGWQKMSFAF